MKYPDNFTIYMSVMGGMIRFKLRKAHIQLARTLKNLIQFDNTEQQVHII